MADDEAKNDETKQYVVDTYTEDAIDRMSIDESDITWEDDGAARGLVYHCRHRHVGSANKSGYVYVREGEQRNFDYFVC